MGRPCVCCDTPVCFGGNNTSSRTEWIDPPGAEYQTRRFTGDAGFEHDAGEAVLNLAGDTTAQLTIRTTIEPQGIPYGYDAAGHYVYILTCGLRRVPGSVQGAIMGGVYALMFHDEDLAWRLHEHDGTATLGTVIAELTVQDLERTAATAYIVRFQDGTAKVRMLATFCIQSPMEFIDHTPASWPEQSRLGMLGINGGSWEWWGVTCGRHTHRCQDGGASFGGTTRNRDMVHGSATTLVPFDVYAANFGSPFRMAGTYPSGQQNNNSGSVYTEIHNLDDGGFSTLGEIAVAATITTTPYGISANAKIGIFVGHDLIYWDRQGLLSPTFPGMVYHAACDDAGNPTGGATALRNLRSIGRVSGGVSTLAMVFRRVEYPLGSGNYQWLFYVNGGLYYKTAATAGEQILRVGAWWDDASVIANFGSSGTPSWTCGDVVPCSDCPEELRRNPPVGWQVEDWEVSGVTAEGCPGDPCTSALTTCKIINKGCSWSPMNFLGTAIQPGATSSDTDAFLWVVGNDCTEQERPLDVVVNCIGCGAVVSDVGFSIGVPESYEPIPGSYSGGSLTLAQTDECNSGPPDADSPLLNGCDAPASINLTPIHTPIVFCYDL